MSYICIYIFNINVSVSIYRVSGEKDVQGYLQDISLVYIIYISNVCVSIYRVSGERMRGASYRLYIKCI